MKLFVVCDLLENRCNMETTCYPLKLKCLHINLEYMFANVYLFLLLLLVGSLALYPNFSINNLGQLRISYISTRFRRESERKANATVFVTQ